MPLTLGAAPESLTVFLTPGANLSLTLRSSTPWPSGTKVTLVLEGITWTAAISGTDIIFTQDEDRVLEVLAKLRDGWGRGELWHELNGTRTLWARGAVRSTAR